MVFVFSLALLADRAAAQDMMRGNMMTNPAYAAESADDGHTAKEEAEGKEIWGKLQAKQIECVGLADGEFASLGEYFMGLMMGASHEAMNNMMVQMMGEKGEEQMHVVMGKRLSGCDTSAAFPGNGLGYMPMMNMMGGGYGPMPMMGLWGGSYGLNSGTEPRGMMGYNPVTGRWGWAGFVSTFLWWLLIFTIVFAIIRWAMRRGKGGSALDTLKERYAKGEISKHEFEEKKKDLS